MTAQTKPASETTNPKRRVRVSVLLDREELRNFNRAALAAGRTKSQLVADWVDRGFIDQNCEQTAQAMRAKGGAL